MNAGQLIADRYLIVAELASGGMGITYRAWDKVLSRPVVIKMPKQECLRDPVHLARFRREIDLMNTHPHSSIVPVIGSGELDGQAYIAMRFLPGGSLADRQRGGQYGDQRPKPAEALHLWLPAIATALDFLHEKQVVHRDIKPSNIFFDSYFNAFLGDFGLAKGADFGAQELTETNAGLGTLAYTPPEQLQRSKTVDSRADQYALAVSVFEYLAGRKPFVGEKKHVVLEVLEDEPPRLSSVISGVPELLCSAVRQAMSRLPENRFSSCSAFAAIACRDVPVPSLSRDVARMLCPACKRIIKLRPSVAGQTGRCPKCQAPMTAAADLSAFWLVSEDPTQRVASVLSELPEASRLDDSSSGQRGPLFERDDFSQILSAVDCESPDLSPQQEASLPDATGSKSGGIALVKPIVAESSLPLWQLIWLLLLMLGVSLSLNVYFGFWVLGS